MRKQMRNQFASLGVAAFLATTGHAAVFTETFDTSAGWTNLSGEAAFTAPAGVIQLSFDSGGSPGGFIDAFRAQSGSADTNLFGDYSVFTGFSFQFFGNILPQETEIILGSGATLISRPFTYTALNSFSTFTFSLGSSSGWSAPGDFNTVISNVDQILISVNSFGTGVQTFQLDNFSLLNTPITAIPEPGSGLFVVGACVLFLARNWRKELRLKA
jgi:hypothetical protein